MIMMIWRLYMEVKRYMFDIGGYMELLWQLKNEQRNQVGHQILHDLRQYLVFSQLCVSIQPAAMC